MGAISGFFRNVWNYVRKKKKRQKKLTGPAKVLERNKNVEQWKEKEPLLHGDYTEYRWQQSVLDSPIQCKKHQHHPSCCTTPGCGCSLVKQYTRALVEGDLALAERIRNGEVVADSNPSSKKPQNKEDGPAERPKKLAEVTRKPRPLAVCEQKNKKRQKDERHRVLPESNGDKDKKPKYVSRTCCSKENCGCRVIKEYSRAVAMGDQETAARIISGSDSEPKDVVDSENKAKGSSALVTEIESVHDNNDHTSSDEAKDKDFKLPGSEIKETEILTEVTKESQSLTESKEPISLDRDKSSSEDSICKSVRWSDTSSSSEESESENAAKDKQARETVDVQVCLPTPITDEVIMAGKTESFVDTPGTITSEESKQPEMDSNFHHVTPSYYETNENVINSITHANKVKKRKKSRKKKEKQVKRQADPTSKKRILKVYEKLIEDSSDSYLTDP